MEPAEVTQQKKMQDVFDEQRRATVRGVRNVIIGLEIAILVPFFAGLVYVSFFHEATISIYTGTAIGLIVLWIALLVPYLAWSIYFFNINLGLPAEDWAEIRLNKRNLATSENITRLMEDDAMYEKYVKRLNSIVSLRGIQIPDKNPFSTETMGLPPGTIRGTLALTVTIGGLAMFIASLDERLMSSLAENTFFIDNLEFFKTAFLMVIAFYFGNKSLEALRKNELAERSGTTGTPQGGALAGSAATQFSASQVANSAGLVSSNRTLDPPLSKVEDATSTKKRMDQNFDDSDFDFPPDDQTEEPPAPGERRNDP